MAGQSAGRTDPQRVKAIRIACCGERCAGVEDMSEHEIPLDHNVFDLGEECPISKIIGIPILVSKIRPSLQYAATRDTLGYDLDPRHYRILLVEQLMVCCDSKLVEEEEGSAKLLRTPERWMKSVGNVIVARADRKPLYAHHVKALHDFVYPLLPSTWYHPMFKALDMSRTGKAVYHGKQRPKCEEELLRQLEPGDFKDFYLERQISWRIEMGESGALAKLPTPWSWPKTPIISPRRNQIR